MSLAEKISPRVCDPVSSKTATTVSVSNLIDGFTPIDQATRNEAAGTHYLPEEVFGKVESPNDPLNDALAQFSTLTVTFHGERLSSAIDIRMVNHTFAALSPVSNNLKSWVVASEYLYYFSVLMWLRHPTTDGIEDGVLLGHVAVG